MVPSVSSVPHGSLASSCLPVSLDTPEQVWLGHLFMFGLNAFLMTNVLHHSAEGLIPTVLEPQRLSPVDESVLCSPSGSLTSMVRVVCGLTVPHPISRTGESQR